MALISLSALYTSTAIKALVLKAVVIDREGEGKLYLCKPSTSLTSLSW
jgi:hypothetical protein